MTGQVALHGGGEYVAGDEPAMDALVAAALRAAGGPAEVSAASPVRIVLVPAAAARWQEVVVANGRRAFEAAAARAGVPVRVDAAMAADRASADTEEAAAVLRAADLVHLPGGDPDRVPSILAGTHAWGGILHAHAAGACVAGASAGAMALCERLWTARGPMTGLGLVPGAAVLPHWDPDRLVAWRGQVDPDGRLTWIGLDERTLVIGRPGEAWTVAGRGRAHVVQAGGAATARSGGAGDTLSLA